MDRQDRSDGTLDRRRFIEPKWPDESFFLLALTGGWTIGPFTQDGWGRGPDGTLVWADGSHPVVLRVRGQEGDVIHANDGSVQRMDFQIIPVSQAPSAWLGSGPD